MKRLSLSALATAVALGLSAPSIATPPPFTDADALARALGIAADRLQGISASSEVLLDGREVRTVKAIDAATGEPVGGAFHDGLPVDARRLRAEAGANWRMAYGALTPALLERVRRAAATDRIVAQVAAMTSLGFDRVYLHHVGRDQAPFHAAAERVLLPLLREAL